MLQLHCFNDPKKAAPRLPFSPFPWVHNMFLETGAQETFGDSIRIYSDIRIGDRSLSPP